MTRWYWGQVDGVLIEKFNIATRTNNNAQRFIDGLIILGECKEIIPRDNDVDLANKELIAIQAKNKP